MHGKVVLFSVNRHSTEDILGLESRISLRPVLLERLGYGLLRSWWWYNYILSHVWVGSFGGGK